MRKIEFTKEEKATLVAKLKLYLQEEHALDIGRFDAEFMLDFLSEEFGGYFYNRGLHDAMAAFEARLDSISDAIYELEKPTSS